MRYTYAHNGNKEHIFINKHNNKKYLLNDEVLIEIQTSQFLLIYDIYCSHKNYNPSTSIIDSLLNFAHELQIETKIKNINIRKIRSGASPENINTLKQLDFLFAHVPQTK